MKVQTSAVFGAERTMLKTSVCPPELFSIPSLSRSLSPGVFYLFIY